MLAATVWHARLWLESIEDQVPADVSREVQTSKSDLTARGVAFDLLQLAKRELARSAKPPNTKICPGRKVSPWTTSLMMIEEAIEPIGETQRNSQ